jgi:hypothetical protein
MLHAALEASLTSRPEEDLVAMCLRKPEAEATDALRWALNRRGATEGYLARRETSVVSATLDFEADPTVEIGATWFVVSSLPSLGF